MDFCVLVKNGTIMDTPQRSPHTELPHYNNSQVSGGLTKHQTLAHLAVLVLAVKGVEEEPQALILCPLPVEVLGVLLDVVHPLEVLYCDDAIPCLVQLLEGLEDQILAVLAHWWLEKNNGHSVSVLAVQCKTNIGHSR